MYTMTLGQHTPNVSVLAGIVSMRESCNIPSVILSQWKLKWRDLFCKHNETRMSTLAQGK